MACRTILTGVIVIQLWFLNGLSILLDGPDIQGHFYTQPQSAGTRCVIQPNDPNFVEQWYLGDKSPDNYYGINVINAWSKCYNGTGILVGVVDVGIDTSNPDLKNQVVWNRTSELHLQHGTEVAGLIAAETNNGIFGTGIAFGAKLADLSYVINGENIPIAAEAFTEGYKQGVDIYSCSFSRGVDGKSIYKMPNKLREAMDNGTKYGRKNTGSLYVVSSGNGGVFFVPESCAYDAFKNNINAILVAGVDPTLGTMPSGEKCGAIMITAPTRTLGNNILPKMLTTSGSGTTSNFGMTSAAVAITSGSIAVLLSARPELTHRDVMHILTRTARNNLTVPFKPSSTPFTCNGAGFAVSPQFGFGLIDVDAMVDEARQWQLVGKKVTCKSEPKKFELQMGPKAEYKLNVDLSCQIRYLEHIEVSMTMSDSHAGTLVVDLISPSSFKSNILPGRAMDHRTYINITVASVQFWGNDPRGEWNMTVHNKYFDLNGTVEEITLTLHGLEQKPLRTMRKCSESVERSTRDIDIISQNDNSSHDDKTTTTGIVVGVTVGCIVGVGVAIVTVFVLYKRKSCV